MSFRYFAYGSNLLTSRMRSRCPSAKVVGTAVLDGWAAVYDKPSTDGSAKLNIRPEPSGSVHGVVYEVDDVERTALDEAEPRYTPVFLDIDGEPTLTYTYEDEPHRVPPYDWYVDMVLTGARLHGVPTRGLAVPSQPDPSDPGRPIQP
jgi:gamma-glutamylcyclotransferase